MDDKEKKKADKLTFDKRVNSISDRILLGYQTKHIIAYAFSMWGVGERMVYKYIASAKNEHKEARKGDINERIDFYIAAKMKLYNELKDKSSPKGAAVADDILTGMAKIEGLMTDKVDVTSKGKELKYQTGEAIDYTKLSLEELQQLKMIHEKCTT